MKRTLMIATLLAVTVLGANAHAKDYTVKELNTGAAGTFVFEPAFLAIQPGDTVHFIATDAGHDTHSYLVPSGAKDWNSEISKDMSVKFMTPGVYLYDCTPHHMFGMLGVIQVGKAVNKTAAEKAAADMEAKQLMNQGRLEKLMKEIK